VNVGNKEKRTMTDGVKIVKNKEIPENRTCKRNRQGKKKMHRNSGGSTKNQYGMEKRPMPIKFSVDPTGKGEGNEEKKRS